MHVPVISEGTAKRQAAAARGVLTRALRELDEASDPTAGHFRCDVGRARRKLAAAENRLAAIQSQRPERYMRAWDVA